MTRNEKIEIVATQLSRTVPGLSREEADAVAQESVGLFDNRPALRSLLTRYGKLNRPLDRNQLEGDEARRSTILFLLQVAGITPAQWLGETDNDR